VGFLEIFFVFILFIYDFFDHAEHAGQGCKSFSLSLCLGILIVDGRMKELRSLAPVEFEVQIYESA
jgi:hypothetical protein